MFTVTFDMCIGLSFPYGQAVSSLLSNIDDFIRVKFDPTARAESACASKNDWLRALTSFIGLRLFVPLI